MLFHNQPLIFLQRSCHRIQCVTLDRLVIIFSSASVVFTSLLFFFRIRAVFNTYPWVVAFFAGLWVSVLGGCLVFIVDIFFTGVGHGESCVEHDPNLYQSRHGCFHSVVNHHSPDKRYSCFPGVCPVFQILYLLWIPSGILQGNVSGWTGLLLVGNFLIIVSCFKTAHRLFFSTGPSLP